MDSLPSLTRRGAVKTGLGAVGLLAISERVRGQESGPTLDESNGEIRLSNEAVSVTFDSETGGIVQISDDAGNKLRNSDGPAPDATWGLDFYSTEYDNVITSSWRSSNPEITTSSERNEVRFTGIWTDAQVKAPGNPDYSPTFEGDITVTATVKAGEPRVYWDMSVENHGEMAIRSLRYPYITNINGFGSPENESIILPSRSGRKVNDPIPLNAYSEVRYPSGFGTMQFTAYIGESAGFHFDARDTEGYTKRLTWGNQWTGDEHIYYRHQYNVPRSSGSDVSVPYQTTTGPIESSWYDAADSYRSWVETTDILLDSEKTYPEWYLNRGATIHAKSYERPSSTGDQNVCFEETADRVIGVKEDLDVPLQFLWWGYQKHGNFGGGDWFPPKEGWDAFDNVVSRLSEHDITLTAYALTNKLIAASDLWQESKSRAEKWIQRNRNQEPKSSTTHGQTWYKSELTEEGWQKQLTSAFTKHVEHGAKQIQLDGFPWTGTPECYSDHHSHPPGRGGNWYSTESKRYISELKTELSSIDETILVSGEGFCEFYLPELDIAMTRDVRAEAEEDDFQESDIEVIPLTQYTLGDQVAFRGSNHFPLVEADWTEPDQYLRLIIGRSIEWGMQPLFRVAVQTPERIESEPLLQFLERVASVFHVHGTRFMVHGELNRKPAIDVPQVTTSTEGPYGNSVTVRSDAVLHSVWESSVLDGTERAAMFANISESSQSVTLKQGHLTDDDDLVYSVVNGEYSLLDSSVSAGEEDLEIPARSVVLVVSTPYSETKREAVQQIRRVQSNGLDGVSKGVELFVNGSPSEAISYLEGLEPEFTETATSDGTETSGDGTTSPTHSSSTSRASNSTETESPGFSALTGVGGLSLAAARYLRRITESDESEKE